jgi:hypothetical protein
MKRIVVAPVASTRRALVTLSLILAANPLHSQASRSPVARPGSRVAFQVFVAIADDEVSRRPVSGLTLGFIQSANDTALAVTDRTGAAVVLLAPGHYRLVSLVPIQWKGLRYSWNTAIVVREDMPAVDLGSSQATISRIAAVVAVSDGETAPRYRAPASTPPAEPIDSTNDIPRTPSINKSHSSGFFIGLGAEGNGLTTSQGSAVESGGGTGLIVGYGFDRRWALYGDLSGAVMNAADGGTYSLGHLDLGARVHFRTGPNVVVPFLQFGLVGRTIAATVNGDNVSFTGGGVSFGGGFNAHFTSSVALSTAVTWSVGTFNNFQIDNVAVGGLSLDATTARLHLGIIWFPQ